MRRTVAPRPAIMLSIFHLDTGMELRGGQRQLLLLAERLQERKHQQVVACPEGSKLGERARREGWPVLGLPGHSQLKNVLWLRRQLRADLPQILHAHDGRAQTLAWMASLGFPVRRVASRRVSFLPPYPYLHRLKYQYSCHAVIAVSSYVRQLLIQLGVPGAKIEVIPDGVDAPAVWPDAVLCSQVRAEWGVSKEEFVFGNVGAMTAEKGQEVAIEAMALLRDRLPQARLFLAGDGPTRERVEARIQKAGLENRVRLLGYVEDLTRFFAGVDLFVMPSLTEGLGSSVLLAMAHGLPVIASQVGGLPEIVEEGKTGWLAPPGSAIAFAEVMADAAADRERLRTLAQAARRCALAFSTETMADRTEALYRRLLGSGKS